MKVLSFDRSALESDIDCTLFKFVYNIFGPAFRFWAVFATPLQSGL